MVEVTGRTRIWGILADPVGHVKTPQMINAVASERGVDGVVLFRQRAVGGALRGADRVFVHGMGVVVLRGLLGLRLLVSALSAEDGVSVLVPA